MNFHKTLSGLLLPTVRPLPFAWYGPQSGNCSCCVTGCDVAEDCLSDPDAEYMYVTLPDEFDRRMRDYYYATGFPSCPSKDAYPIPNLAGSYVLGRTIGDANWGYEENFAFLSPWFKTWKLTIPFSLSCGQNLCYPSGLPITLFQTTGPLTGCGCLWGLSTVPSSVPGNQASWTLNYDRFIWYRPNGATDGTYTGDMEITFSLSAP